MYKEILEKGKIEYTLPNKGRSGVEIGMDRIKDMISGFCTIEDIDGVPPAKVMEAFDKYCEENGYPLINQKAFGMAIMEYFPIKRKHIRHGNGMVYIYVKND